MRAVHRETLITSGGALLAALVAALVAGLVTALPAGGQAHVRIIAADSVFVRVGPPSRALLDSIDVLMRAIEAEQPDSPTALALRQQIDALIPRSRTVVFNRTRAAIPLPLGWIGITPQGPVRETISSEGDVIEYYAYPSIIAVDPESPAQKAGIEVGDVLIAYNGVDVRGRPINLTQLLVPDRKITITVRRDGVLREYAVIAARAPAHFEFRRYNPSAPSGDDRFETIIAGIDSMQRLHIGPLPEQLMGQRMPFGGPPAGARPSVAPSAETGLVISMRGTLLSPTGAFGAVLSTVSPELSRTLKLDVGVLVNDVARDTPAARAGLRPGDVIVTVSGQAVRSLRALQDVVRTRIAEQSVALRVMRDHRAQVVTVSW